MRYLAGERTDGKGLFVRVVVVAALAGAALWVPGRSAGLDGEPPCGPSRIEEQVPGAPVAVELVTVTDRSFTVTWLTCGPDRRPLPSDTTVAYGTDPRPSTWRTVTVETGTPFHHAEIGGLEPGTTYHYQVSSGGLPGRPDRYHPGTFTTLRPPAGKELFSFAVLADVHVGEHTSGQAGSVPGLGAFPPSYTGDHYATTMAGAAVAEVNRRKVKAVLLPGDSTSHGERHQMEELQAVVAGLEAPSVIARGSHDRANQYAEAVAECGADGDCFRAVFFPDRPVGAAPQPIFHSRSFKGPKHARYRVVALDSADPATGTGRLGADQLSWLEGELDAAVAAGEEVFVFFHHPVSEWSTTLAVPPAVFGVRQDEAHAFLRLVGGYDNVRAVFTAHTHRNWLGYSPFTGRLPIVEVGPVKEYPGGYTVVRVYRDGFMRTFHRTACPACREWQATTRGEYFGRYPDYTTGSLRDRNFVHRWDGPDVPGVPSLPFNVWPPALPLEG